MAAGDQLIRGDDEYFDREVGCWSSDEHHLLKRYLEMFTTAMRKKWELHCIDLFCGPGRCRIRGTDQTTDGSPLIAAKARYKFNRLHFCDLDERCVESLRARLAGTEQPSEPDIRCGDANQLAKGIVDSIPSDGTLSLAFLDPTGLHLHYATIRELKRRKIDLILFFPDSLDARRNWRKYYLGRTDSNLSKVLGASCDWRSRIEQCPPTHVLEEFRSLYETQLGELGFTYRDTQRISSNGVQLYLLIFCSAHEVGLDLWRKAGLKEPNGQRLLDFD